MIQEYQVIEHNYYRGLNLFLSKLYYRAPHYHRECELMMALEGEADIIFSNGKVSRLTEGNIAVIGPMEMHEMRSGETVCCLSLSRLPLPCWSISSPTGSVPSLWWIPI